MSTNKCLIGVTLSMLFAFVGCNSSKSNSNESSNDTLCGVVGDDTSMHVLQVVLGRDTTDFYVGDSCDVTNANLAIGNLVEVVYKKNGDENVALKITGDSTYVNALGKWTAPITGQKGVEGLKLDINGEASSINMNTLVYKNWSLTYNTGKILVEGESIGNGAAIQFSDTAVIRYENGGWVMKMLGTGVEYAKEDGF